MNGTETEYVYSRNTYSVTPFIFPHSFILEEEKKERLLSWLLGNSLWAIFSLGRFHCLFPLLQCAQRRRKQVSTLWISIFYPPFLSSGSTQMSFSFHTDCTHPFSQISHSLITLFFSYPISLSLSLWQTPFPTLAVGLIPPLCFFLFPEAESLVEGSRSGEILSQEKREMKNEGREREFPRVFRIFQAKKEREKKEKEREWRHWGEKKEP